LSTAEGTISQIDSQYKDILKLIRETQEKVSEESLSLDEARVVVSEVVRFQRFLEAEGLRLAAFKGAAYFDRASNRFNAIVEKCTSVKNEKTYYYTVGSYQYAYYAQGLTPEVRRFFSLCKNVDKQNQIKSVLGMRELLEDMELDFVEFFADLRLMTESEIFPFEKRMVLKDKLVRSSYADVVDNLESAEQNLTATPPHMKDVLPNCRLAIEAMFYSLMQKKGVTPKRKFAFDLATFSQSHPEVIDDGTKQMIQGVFSYLSVKGAHAISPTDKANLDEINLGLEQTYSMISLLLSKAGSGSPAGG
jgi:hypothetical protein